PEHAAAAPAGAAVAPPAGAVPLSAGRRPAAAAMRPGSARPGRVRASRRPRRAGVTDGPGRRVSPAGGSHGRAGAPGPSGYGYPDLGPAGAYVHLAPACRDTGISPSACRDTASNPSPRRARASDPGLLGYGHRPLGRPAGRGHPGPGPL